MMAPNPQPPDSSNSNGSKARFSSLEKWLEAFGVAEYALYKKDNATPYLTYEDWASSGHALGPFLYYTTLDIWEAESSSDEDEEPGNSQTDKHVPPGLLETEPTKSVTTNGHSISHSKGSATPKAGTKPSESSSATKQKRRRRKKVLSEKIVASDDNDNDVVGDSTLADEVVTPPAPSAATVNERHKSASRKQKRKYKSQEFLAPEDLEEDESISVAEVAAPAAAVDTPSGTAGHSTTTTPSSTRPRTVSGRRPRKKYLSEAIVASDDDETAVNNPAPDISVPQPTAALSPTSDSTQPFISSPSGTNSPPKRATPTTAAPSESPEGGSPGSRPSRRGLRVRTPAQQRPYYHHAKLFEEADTAVREPEASAKTSPRTATTTTTATTTAATVIAAAAATATTTTRLAQVSYPEDDSEEVLEDDDDDGNNDNNDKDDDENDSTSVDADSSPKGHRHFKGKGRAWKKNESDEDLDYVSPAKSKPTTPVAKSARCATKQAHRTARPESRGRGGRGGRPRKSESLSQMTVQDDKVSDAEAAPAVNPEQDVEMSEAPPMASATAHSAHLTPKPAGGSGNSDQSVTSKADGDEGEGDEATPIGKSTPKGRVKKLKVSVSPGVNESREVSPKEKADEAVVHGRGEEEEGSIIEGGSAPLSPLLEMRKRKSQGEEMEE